MMFVLPCNFDQIHIYISQITFGVERLLLGHPEVRCVHEVFDHVALQNGRIQEAAITPDHYLHGELMDGRTFEAIGDSKQHVSNSIINNTVY